ncbi:MAG: CarD family transcriptional regulator [Oscillospiraceae bacterium]|nr:CarD family transcriptional regulator [Oscillospiraceae bacterium]
MIPQPNAGEYVRYGGTGICLVDRVEKMPFPDEQHMRLCCQLKPISNPAMAILVPLDNETLCAKMKPLLTREEVDSMIVFVQAQPSLWNEERKQRNAEFRRLLASGDACCLLQLLRTLELQEDVLRAARKKLSAADLAARKEAMRIVTEEFMYSLHISAEEAEELIRTATQAQMA